MEYRIKSYQYFDELGIGREIKYFIEYKATFLVFWKRWKPVTHVICGMGDCYSVTTYFSSLPQAEDFAKNHLCEGKLYDGTEIKTVKSLNCKSRQDGKQD